MPFNDPAFLLAIVISGVMVSTAAYAIQRARIRSPKTMFERMQRLFYLPFLGIALLALIGLVILVVARWFGVTAPFPRLSGIQTGSSEGAIQVATDVVSLLCVLVGFGVALNVRGAAIRARGWAATLQPASSSAAATEAGSPDLRWWRIGGLVVGSFALVLLVIPRLP